MSFGKRLNCEVFCTGGSLGLGDRKLTRMSTIATQCKVLVVQLQCHIQCMMWFYTPSPSTSFLFAVLMCAVGDFLFEIKNHNFRLNAASYDVLDILYLMYVIHRKTMFNDFLLRKNCFIICTIRKTKML